MFVIACNLLALVFINITKHKLNASLSRSMEDSGIDSEDRQSNIYEDGAAGLLVSVQWSARQLNNASCPSYAENCQRSAEAYV